MPDWTDVAKAMRAAAAKNGWSLPEWFMRRLCMVVDEREAGQAVKKRFVPNGPQQRLLRDLWYLNVVLKSRQHGISTFVALFFLATALLRNNTRAGIVDRTDLEAQQKLAKIRFAYEHLDDPDLGPIAELGKAIKMATPLVPPTSQHQLSWANGSSIRAAMSLRGAAYTLIWISEYGYIAQEDPDRADEIETGTLNAIHPGNTVIIESTHKGGRYGHNYARIRRAQASKPPLGLMDWRFHFFGWTENEANRLPVPPWGLPSIPAGLAKHLADLEKKIGRKLDPEQVHWYVQKVVNNPAADMAREFPGTAEEALSATSEGAIFGDQMAALRAAGRVCDLVCDGAAPLVTSWDIGMSDLTAIWLLQFVGFDIHALSYHTGNGMTAAQHAAVVLRWEGEYGRPIAAHYLPHDANNRGQGGRTYVDLLRDAGLRNIRVVPRTPDIWTGIGMVRALLPRFRFNQRTCEREFPQAGGTSLPSGLAALEGYRKKIEAVGGQIRELPVHDSASHGSSALRTICEAHSRHMLVAANGLERPAQEMAKPKTAVMGLRRKEALGWRK